MLNKNLNLNYLNSEFRVPLGQTPNKELCMNSEFSLDFYISIETGHKVPQTDDI